MTYSAKELSLYDARPVELYEFSYATKTFRYTSADEQQSYLGNSYMPAQIRRSNVEQTQEINRADLKLELPRDADVAEEFIIYPPAEVMTLRVYRQHRGDGETVLIWIGRVLNCEWSGSIATLTCEAVFTSLRRSGLRRTYCAQCQHVLYSTRCGVVQNSYKTTGSVASLLANVVTVLAADAKPDGYFNGGMLTFLDVTGITHRRAITGHTGAVITLANSIRQLAETNSVDLYPGCDHTLDDCANKFDGNEENFSGFSHSPKINPFDGKTLY
jgi:uncharacterized phage protein (TIGR02218 family)